MAAKKAAAPAAASKKAAAPAKAASAHGSYQDMIKDAIVKLKDRTGSSRQAIHKYINANNKLSGSDAAIRAHISQAIKSGKEKGIFDQPKGPSGPIKLAKPKAAGETKVEPKKPTAPVKATVTAKAPAKKTAAAAKPSAKATTSKAAPAKKATAAKTPAKAIAKKATAAKPKANASQPRKPAVAPAVQEPKTEMHKTRTGRVVKTKVSESAAPAKRKAGSKKTAAKAATPKAKKTSTPKKAATPKVTS